MNSKTIAEFKIAYTQFLDPKGQLILQLPEWSKEISALIELYRKMVQCRVFDTKAINLQRTGKLGTYPSTLGQEAIGVGMGAAMRTEDVLCPYYRDIGAQFWRGVKMAEILLYWGGDERGSDFTNNKNDFPICVPIASQTLHAVGVALAMKLKKESRVTVTALGDGGTSRGDFYEAINLAGVWQLPVVFVINNNQWAISVGRDKQTHSETLAQKGIAAGISSEQVDGNDVIAVTHVVREAVEKARSGRGPTLIEAVTYRMGDHTTADDARRYRGEAELEEHRNEDPILRLKRYLTVQQAWDEEQEKSLQDSANAEVQAAVTEYLNTQAQRPEVMFDYLYATLPTSLDAQRVEASQLTGVKSHG